MRLLLLVCFAALALARTSRLEILVEALELALASEESIRSTCDDMCAEGTAGSICTCDTQSPAKAQTTKPKPAENYVKDNGYTFENIGEGWCRPGAESGCDFETDRKCRTNAIILDKEWDGKITDEAWKKVCENDCAKTNGCVAIAVRRKYSSSKHHRTMTCALYGSVSVSNAPPRWRRTGYKASGGAKPEKSVGDTSGYDYRYGNNQISCLKVVQPIVDSAVSLEQEDSVACGYDFDYDYCFPRSTCLTDESPYSHRSTKGSHWYQKKDKIYRVGNTCYLALTSCMGCLSRPASHTRHLEKVSCGETSGCPARPTRPARPTHPGSHGNECYGMMLPVDAKNGKTCCERKNLAIEYGANGKIYTCCANGIEQPAVRDHTHLYVCKPSTATKLDQLAKLFTQDQSPGKAMSIEALKHYVYGVRFKNLMKFRKNKDRTITAAEISELFQDYDENGNMAEDTAGIDRTIQVLKALFGQDRETNLARLVNKLLEQELSSNAFWHFFSRGNVHPEAFSQIHEFQPN